MTMNDIRNILAIAEHGRITKAAHALYISQPSLSQCLQKVENELGVRLFERNRFGECKPTEAGRIFIEEGTEILVRWKSMVVHLHGQKEKKDFTIGIPIRTGMEVVKGLLDVLEQEIPDITVSFVDKPNYVMEEMVSNGELDMALVRMATPSSGYTIRKLYDLLPAVNLRKGSPLWEKLEYRGANPVPYINLRLLAEEPLVAPPKTKEHRARVFIEKLFAQIPGLTPNIRYTVPNLAMYDRFIQNGTASCVLSVSKIPPNMCQLEPEYALPYSQNFIYGKRTDKEVAEKIYQILYRLRNSDNL